MMRGAEIEYRLRKIRRNASANWARPRDIGVDRPSPMEWIAGLAGLLVMLRREAAVWVTFATGVLSLLLGPEDSWGAGDVAGVRAGFR